VFSVSSRITAFKKKLHQPPPDSDSRLSVETHRTKAVRRREPCDPKSLEREVRQLLADKVSGSHVGIWLLIPELLRLGAWDLISGWSGKPTPCVESRLALQLVHEAALCVTGIRQSRALTQEGFELANGLPFLATDQEIHELLSHHTVAEAENLQIALGAVRRARGHYAGRLLAIDPHRLKSYSKRQMRRRKLKDESTAVKTSQTFFCIDVETHEPLAFTTATSGRTASQATPRLLEMAASILSPRRGRPLVLADCEHFAAALFEHVAHDTPFQLLAPMSNRKGIQERMQALDPALFTTHWPGFATTQVPYRFSHHTAPFHQIVQRTGERPDDYRFKAFVSTHPLPPRRALATQYPQRWHVEEFFNSSQALGWKRAGTLNLDIRSGQMTFALIAQAAIAQLRQRLGCPHQTWDAKHLARDLFAGLDGDIRVADDTIIVTYYNAPNVPLLRTHFEHLPRKLRQENVNPHIPWLFDFQLDFRFK
jgi:hypothetical protein